MLQQQILRHKSKVNYDGSMLADMQHHSQMQMQVTILQHLYFLPVLAGTWHSCSK